jgi:hypothetical protein
MQKPCTLEGVRVVTWTYGGKQRAIPAVFHEAWQAQNGRFAAVFANWTDATQRIRVADERLGGRVVIHDGGKAAKHVARAARGGAVRVTVPPLAMVMVERL